MRVKTSQEIKKLRRALLADYEANGRTLPWRIRPEDSRAGVRPDPYAIWLSEIMCQQTTITAVKPYWQNFLVKWPRVQDLANAGRADVLSAWAGLGYYARARNLHKCANVICDDLGGVFPGTEKELLKLPGIGAYTAAAIAAICYGEACNVVDGNVERVISRLYAVAEKMPKAKAKIRELAGGVADPKRPSDYAQGLMDLGAHICKPRNPKCDLCPWCFACKAYKLGTQEGYPKKTPKKPRPVRYGAVFYVESDDGFWARTRADKGLLGGMTELPGTEWTQGKPPKDIWLSQAPLPKNWQELNTQVKHVFTHFTLYLSVFTARHDAGFPDITARKNKIDTYAFPSLMRKAIILAQDQGIPVPARADAKDQ